MFGLEIKIMTNEMILSQAIIIDAKLNSLIVDGVTFPLLFTQYIKLIIFPQIFIIIV